MSKTLRSSDSGRTFHELADVPIASFGACGIMADNNTYMHIGGTDVFSATSFNSTYILDLSANTWSTGPQMSQARTFFSCNLIERCGRKEIVVMGGMSQDIFCDSSISCFTPSVEIYDIEASVWRKGQIIFLCKLVSDRNRIFGRLKIPNIRL